MFYLIVILVFIACRVISRVIIRSKSQRNLFANEKSLNTRTRYAIYLSGISILSFIVIIQRDNAEREEKTNENSILFVIRDIQRYESIPVRVFIPAIYSQGTLDSLENDYQELKNWMDNNAEKVRQKMLSCEIIDIDSLKIPIASCSISNQELNYFRDNYIGRLKEYNDYVKKNRDIQKEKAVIDFSDIILRYIIPIILIITILIRLNVEDWKDAIGKRQKLN